MVENLAISQSFSANLLIFVRNCEQGAKCMNGIKTTLKPRPPRIKNSRNRWQRSRMLINMIPFKHFSPCSQSRQIWLFIWLSPSLSFKSSHICPKLWSGGKMHEWHQTTIKPRPPRVQNSEKKENSWMRTIMIPFKHFTPCSQSRQIWLKIWLSRSFSCQSSHICPKLWTGGKMHEWHQNDPKT